MQTSAFLPLWSVPSPNRSAELMEVLPDRFSSLVLASYWQRKEIKSKYAEKQYKVISVWALSVKKKYLF